MKALTVYFFIGLSTCCHAQAAPVSKIRSVSGFMEVCDVKDGQLSKARTQALKNTTGNVTDALKKAMDDQLADASLCLNYLAGLSDGWREGYEHGVIAGHFPAGYPADVEKALVALPRKELEDINAAMKTEAPCLPDHVTFGDIQNAVINYVEGEEKKNHPFIGLVSTSRAASWALRDAFPCPATQPK